MKRIVVTWNDVLRELESIPQIDERDNMANRVDPLSKYYRAGDAFKAIIERLVPGSRITSRGQMPHGTFALVIETPDELDTTPPEPKLCIDCGHCDEGSLLCRVVRNMVDGSSAWYCADARATGFCGPEAKYFKPKTSTKGEPQ